MKITVSVTQDDIDRGVPCKSDRCPIARALERMGFFYGSVYETDAILGMSLNQCSPVDLPEVAADFVRHFDMGGPGVEPFDFELDIPDDLALAAFGGTS